MKKTTARSQQTQRKRAVVVVPEKPPEHGREFIWFCKLLIVTSIAVVAAFAVFVKLEVIQLDNAQPQLSKPAEAAPIQQQVHAPSDREMWSVLVGTYIQRHTKFADEYWFQGNEGPEQQIAIVAEWQRQYRQDILHYEKVNAWTERITHTYTAVRVSRYVNGISMFMAGTLDDLKHGKIEVCLIPRNELDKAPFPAMLFYKKEWGALMIAGIKVPGAFRPALVLHELGHAYKHQVEQNPSHAAPPSSDLYMVEEVTMHDVEDAVLNAATDGALWKFFDELLARVKPQSFADLVRGLRPADMERYDQITGIASTGPRLAPTYGAQFFSGIGFRMLEKQGLVGTQLEQAKVDLYRQMTTFSR